MLARSYYNTAFTCP